MCIISHLEKQFIRLPMTVVCYNRCLQFFCVVCIVPLLWARLNELKCLQPLHEQFFFR